MITNDSVDLTLLKTDGLWSSAKCQSFLSVKAVQGFAIVRAVQCYIVRNSAHDETAFLHAHEGICCRVAMGSSNMLHEV